MLTSETVRIAVGRQRGVLFSLALLFLALLFLALLFLALLFVSTALVGAFTLAREA